MMATFLTVPLKKSNEIDITKPLKNIIASNYSTADNPVECNESVNELNKLRNNAVCRPLDKHEKSLEILNRYYDQLNALEKKISASDFQIPFKWRDAFDKGSFFTGRMSLTISSLAYEKACVLFNIAALQSQIASIQDLDSDDGLKLAAKYFQMSSGIFQHLKNTVISSIQQEPTPDIHPDTLSTLQVLMLAQAQETLFRKASADRMKDAIVAKVAMQCEDLYSDASKQVKRESLKAMWDKEWLPIITSKQSMFNAIAEYHQARVALSNKGFGEVLCRTTHAISLLEDANSKGFGFCSYDDELGRVKRMYNETKKDNDFIYHDIIPDFKSLSPIGKAIIVKATPVPNNLCSNFVDLFDALMPVQVHQSLGLFDVRKTELVNNEVGKLREATQLMNSILASLNLPAAIEDSSGSEIPQSIMEKAQSVQEKGGCSAIDKMMIEMPELLQRNSEILNDVESAMKLEEESDNQLRTQFKEKWTRTPSSKLNESLKRDYGKYRQLLNNAIQADHIVRDKYNADKQWMDALSGPIDNLKLKIPSSSPTSNLSNNSTVQALKDSMNQVEQIKAKRDTIESDLKSATVDMKDKFLSSLQQGGINEEVSSVESLGQVYGPLQKEARENIEAQNTLMSKIQEVNTEFCKIKGQNGSANQREKALKDIATAYDTFNELMANLKEGMKFYNDLTQLLVTFQNKVNDFCFARKTEKDELCKDMQHQIVQQPSQPTPAPPTHHTQSNVPERPPPPSSRPVPAPRGSSAPGAVTAPNAPSGVTAPASNPVAPTNQQSNPPYPMPGQPQPNVPYPMYSYPYPPAPMPTGYNPYTQPQGQGQYPQPQGQGQYPQPHGQYPPAPGYQQYNQGVQNPYQPYPPAPGAPGAQSYPPQYPGQW